MSDFQQDVSGTYLAILVSGCKTQAQSMYVSIYCVVWPSHLSNQPSFSCLFLFSCPPSHTSEPSHLLPNCLAFKDQCSHMLCLRGECISSIDGQVRIHFHIKSISKILGVAILLLALLCNINDDKKPTHPWYLKRIHDTLIPIGWSLKFVSK